MRRHLTCAAAGWLWMGLLALPSASAVADSPDGSVPSRQLQTLVARVFAEVHDGWSVDEVLLQDDRRQRFLAACQAELQSAGDLADDRPAEDDTLCRALLHVRKLGGRLPKATQRAERPPAERMVAWQVAAEIAGRRLWDQQMRHTDALLESYQARACFDEFAAQLAPEAPREQLRRLAINLRKARKLEPELLTRVTDWRREIVEYPVDELRGRLDEVAPRPGIYLFRDSTGYLYIGQAQNLRQRLTKHLQASDRQSLAEYLDEHSQSSRVSVELHVFQEGSPAEQLATRRAYESELIRTRKPRLNIAP